MQTIHAILALLEISLENILSLRRDISFEHWSLVKKCWPVFLKETSKELQESFAKETFPETWEVILKSSLGLWSLG